MADEYTPIIDDEWWDRRLGGSADKRTITRLKAENEKLREYVEWLEELALRDPNYYRELKFEFKMKRRELGIEVNE